MPIVSYDRLVTLVRDLFIGYGFNEEQALIIAQNLEDADRHGIASHGIQRMRLYDQRITNGYIKPNEEGHIVHETPAAALIDGRHGMGQIVGTRAMRLAIEKAKKVGIGAVAVRDSNHFGTAGYYASLAADEGLWGYASTNSNALLVPTHSAKPFIGSNPIAVAVPTSRGRFLYDAATTTVSLGKVEVHAKLGEPLPGDWVMNTDGTIDRDAQDVIDNVTLKPGGRGGLTPIGGLGETNSGYKGYGIGAVVELLTAALPLGVLSADVHGQSIGHFFLALDPDAFGGREATEEYVADFVDRLHALPSVDGSPVLVPGDKEFAAADRTDAEGIEVDEKTAREVEEIAARFGVEVPWAHDDADERTAQVAVA